MSWSILPSNRKSMNMVFLNMSLVQCKGTQAWLFRERLDFERHWLKIARNSMWAIQSTAQNALPAELPAAVGGLFLVLKLPPASRYLRSACAGKIQPSLGCTSAACYVNKRNSFKGTSYLRTSCCRSWCSPILPPAGNYSFAFRHVMQRSAVGYWICHICC